MLPLAESFVMELGRTMGRPQRGSCETPGRGDSRTLGPETPASGATRSSEPSFCSTRGLITQGAASVKDLPSRSALALSPTHSKMVGVTSNNELGKLDTSNPSCWRMPIGLMSNKALKERDLDSTKTPRFIR